MDWRTVTPDYFKTIGIPLKRGRAFTEDDNGQWFDQVQPEKPLVGIVDDQLASAFWPNEDPIGRRFRLGENLPWAVVIGVVGHIRHDRLDEDVRPQVYWNYKQRAQDRAVLVMKTRRDPELLTASVLSEIRAADRDQPVYDIRTMKEVVDRSISQQWLNTMLLIVFASSSLLLTSIGIYGVISYSVRQRLREFGIRMALGAGRRSLFSFVLRQAAILISIGVGIGLTVSWLAAGILSRLLYGVPPTDWLTYTVSTFVLICIALLATFVPARRAARTDPVSALR